MFVDVLCYNIAILDDHNTIHVHRCSCGVHVFRCFVSNDAIRNGLLQPLGAWMVLGLVMCDGLLFLAARSKDLKGFGIYSRAYYTRSQGLEPSRRGVRAFLEPQPWVHGVGHGAQC